VKTIKSFEVDHTKIEKGMYVSRTDADITTYDIRMVKPNTPPYLKNSGLHTFEHLFATCLRNSESGRNIVYVGPMGCRTGFYLLTRGLTHDAVIKIVVDAMSYIKNFNGIIPGASEKECGNYKDHDLKKAKIYAADMLEVLKKWSPSMLSYNL
jgi:S-ribosylhomocysteine lyase